MRQFDLLYDEGLLSNITHSDYIVYSCQSCLVSSVKVRLSSIEQRHMEGGGGGGLCVIGMSKLGIRVACAST